MGKKRGGQVIVEIAKAVAAPCFPGTAGDRLQPIADILHISSGIASDHDGGNRVTGHDRTPSPGAKMRLE